MPLPQLPPPPPSLTPRLAPLISRRPLLTTRALHAHPQVQQPTTDYFRKARIKLTILGELCEAWRLADCDKIMSFAWDESQKFQTDLASTNFQVVAGARSGVKAGSVIDVVGRGAFVIPGGTAEQVSARERRSRTRPASPAHQTDRSHRSQVSVALERHVFEHLRKLLTLAKEEWKRRHPDDAWPGPDPAQIAVHRLAGATLLTDSCNSARAARRSVEQMVAEAVEQHVGAAAWARLSLEEQKSKVHVYSFDCFNHLRNICLSATTAAASKHLQESLGESLKAFSSFERMSTDIRQLVRGTYKECHPGGDYAKGKGKEGQVWRFECHPSTPWLRLERADGGRQVTPSPTPTPRAPSLTCATVPPSQDLDFDAAVPMLVNLPVITAWLHKLIFREKHKNILESFLWHVYTCQEMVAQLRALSLFAILLSKPLRWLTGKGGKRETLVDWSPFKASWCFDLFEQALAKTAADGRVLLDPNFDAFAAVAAQQPAFKAWRDRKMTKMAKTHDGTVSFNPWQLALREARTPSDESERCRAMTIKLIEVRSRHREERPRAPALTACSPPHR